MRLTREIDGTAYWIEVKDKWSRNDLKRWDAASDFDLDPAMTDRDAVDEAVHRVQERKVALLAGWSTGCYLEDVDGNEYHRINELTPDALDAMDAPLYDLVMSAALEARTQRARLGEPSGRRR